MIDKPRSDTPNQLLMALALAVISPYVRLHKRAFELKPREHKRECRDKCDRQHHEYRGG